MPYVFAPGCALALYKPHLAEKILKYLQEQLGDVPLYPGCCHDEVVLPAGTTIINCCPGCNRRFPLKNPAISTVSLWELIADRGGFPFPDYNGAAITIHDACPTRNVTSLHAAVRKLLDEMHLRVVEPTYTKTQQHCCGDSAYPAKPLAEVYAAMKQRADEMPEQDVCVYCVSCVNSMNVGGKSPRYLVDLLFQEPTIPVPFETDDWHRELEAFRKAH